MEVAIKRLESMLLDEMINLRSKGLITFYSDSRVDYDALAGTFEKDGRCLKVGDRILKDSNIMEVQDFVFSARVLANALVKGIDYDILLPRERIVRSFRLIHVDQASDWYQFAAHEPGVKDVSGSFDALPPVYLLGQGRRDPSGIIVEANGSKRELSFDVCKDKKFRLDFSATHVMVALG